MMTRFTLGIFAGLLGTAAVVMGAFTSVALFLPAYLPPPALSRLDHLDFKLRFLRERPNLDPKILAIGSSITWRQLAGDIIDQSAGSSGAFLNGATTHLQIHQTRRLLEELYLPRYKQVRTVVVLTSVPDFDECTNEPVEMLDPTDAARYAFKHWPAGLFYLRYFAPARYIKTGLGLRSRKAPFEGDLFIDKYGSGPVAISPQRRAMLGLRYGSIGLDPKCTDALVDLARDMSARHIRLIVVFTPVHPDYRNQFRNSMGQLDTVIASAKQMTARFRTEIITLQSDQRFKADEFYDAFHLQWPGVQKLTALLASKITEQPPVSDKLKSPPMAMSPTKAGIIAKIPGTAPDAQ